MPSVFCFGIQYCHSERSEESRGKKGLICADGEILRFAQGDKRKAGGQKCTGLRRIYPLQ